MTRMTWGSKPHESKINPPGRRGGEHNSLVVGPAVVDDPHDLGLEPHDSKITHLGNMAENIPVWRLGRQLSMTRMSWGSKPLTLR